MFNLDDLDLAIKDNETEDEYVIRICGLKEKKGLYWDEIANILNKALDYNYTESRYRKIYAAYKKGIVDAIENEPNEEVNELIQKRIELQKEKVKLSDERIQANAYIRQLAREETIKEIASQFAKEMNGKKILDKPSGKEYIDDGNSGILCISDWHYGIQINNFWNKYNPEIAKQRIAKLRDEVIAKGLANGVEELHVVNLSDMICGRIHLNLRLESRFDVITQTMEISEILAEFLIELAKYFKVHYYDCLDNHSRLEPNKKDAMDLESLARIIPWYLKERIGDVISIHDNVYDEEIISFRCKNYDIIAVHGDHDAPGKVISNLSLMTHRHYDLVLTAHLHHFSADEQQETLVVSNGSLMGTDTYAKNLRLSSKPSQNFIIVTDEHVMECLYRIVL